LRRAFRNAGALGGMAILKDLDGNQFVLSGKKTKPV
jgi:hypothetical protein